MPAAQFNRSSAAAARKTVGAVPVARKPVVRLTANFEHNLADIERFLTEAEAPQAYDALLDELLDTVIPNLQRFPGIGRPFLANAARSVETTNALEALRAKLSALTPDPDALRRRLIDWIAPRASFTRPAATSGSPLPPPSIKTKRIRSPSLPR